MRLIAGAGRVFFGPTAPSYLLTIGSFQWNNCSPATKAGVVVSAAWAGRMTRYLGQ